MNKNVNPREPVRAGIGQSLKDFAMMSWLQLTRPAEVLEDDEQRVTVRLLLGLLLALLLVASVILPIWVLANPRFPAAFWIAISTCVTVGLCYLISRTRFYRFGIYILIALFPCMIIAILITAPGSIPERLPALNFLMVAILLASLLLSIRETILLVIACMLFIAVFFFVPGVNFPTIYSYLVFTGTMSALFIATNLIRNYFARQLKQSEARYRHMFENNIAVKLVIDPETGAIVDANSAAVAFYGYSISQFQSMSIQDINTLTDEEVRAEMTLATQQQRKVFYFRHRLASGEIRDVEVFSGPVIFDDKNYLYSIVQDVTARKEAEHALQESEARHRALLMAIPDMMFRNHRDGTYLDFHAQDIDALYISPDSFIGRKIPDVLPPPMTETYMQHLEQALQTGDEQVFEYQLLMHEQLMAYEARMVSSGQDEVITIVRDMTERKQAQQQAFELELEKARLHVLSNFLEKAAHEFRTPLSIINTSVHIILRTDNQEQRQRKSDAVRTQVRRLARLVDTMLTMIRLESQPAPPVTDVDMGAVLASVCEEIREKYDNTILLQCPEALMLPPVRADNSDLITAFEQLMDNACRFTPAGGTVALDSGLAQGFVWLEIQDSGPGIDAADLPHIFETFWRQDEAHSTPGFGLGLPIAKKIIESYGGHIEVKSQKDSGTGFRVYLPLANSGKHLPEQIQQTR